MLMLVETLGMFNVQVLSVRSDRTEADVESMRTENAAYYLAQCVLDNFHVNHIT